MYRLFIGILFFCCLSLGVYAAPKLPDLKPDEVVSRTEEAFSAHATQKKFDSQIAARTLLNYLEALDPMKTYLFQSEVALWIEPSEDLLEEIVKDYHRARFPVFIEINQLFQKSIERHHRLQAQINDASLPPPPATDTLKDLPWPDSEETLLQRLQQIRSLQLHAIAKLSPQLQENAKLRMAKHEKKFQEEMMPASQEELQKRILRDVLRAIVSSLDAHSTYFTPSEAVQFMIEVQQRLFGIGVLLRDDLKGFRIIQIVEGSPAANQKQLKLKDLIIGVNGESVVGMDSQEVVDLIRGEENSHVRLTILRETAQLDGSSQEELLEFDAVRGRIVLKESRYKSSYEPYGDGVIGYLKLYSFYRDQDGSSSEDLKKAIEELQKQHHVKGLVLDLRSNLGGLLEEAVNVTGLFIKKGVVVSIKDEQQQIHKLRLLEDRHIFDGPLMVLTNRMSASSSEIVAQALQDYGRAFIVGDDHSYGKGSFQTFSLAGDNEQAINPKGEIKITRGIYYPVGGKTPQETGVLAQVHIPGALAFSEVGERYLKYPLKPDQIPPSYEDDLSDLPFYQRSRAKRYYLFDLEQRQSTYQPFLSVLQEHAHENLNKDPNYQNFLFAIQKAKDGNFDLEDAPPFGQNDLQLEQAVDVLKEFLFLQHAS